MTELVRIEPDMAELHVKRDAAKRSVFRGLALVLLVPVAVVVSVGLAASFDSFGPLLIAALYTTVGGSVGVAMLASGVIRMRIATKELDRIEAERIPQARLLT